VAKSSEIAIAAVGICSIGLELILRLLQEYNFISLSSAKFFATSFQSKQ
jgi:hypothetical protein